MIGTIKMNE